MISSNILSNFTYSKDLYLNNKKVIVYGQGDQQRCQIVDIPSASQKDLESSMLKNAHLCMHYHSQSTGKTYVTFMKNRKEFFIDITSTFITNFDEFFNSIENQKSLKDNHQFILFEILNKNSGIQTLVYYNQKTSKFYAIKQVKTEKIHYSVAEKKFKSKNMGKNQLFFIGKKIIQVYESLLNSTPYKLDYVVFSKFIYKNLKIS